MEQKHTPGPWKVSGLISIALANGWDTYRAIQTEDEMIAKVYGKDIANAELIAQVPDLFAKVSEQEKEIEALKIMVKEKYDYMTKPLTFENKEVSEQSQRIEALTKENERLQNRENELAAALHNQMDITDALSHGHLAQTVIMKAKELSRLREEKKELVEALKERINMLNPADDWTKFEYNFLNSLLAKQSLLSKFEVPNT